MARSLLTGKEVLPARRSVSMAASKVDLKDPSWRTFRLRNETWQEEAWRFYDLVGELHAAATWMGSACSRVRIFVAVIDKYGRIGEEARADEVQALSDTLFGGPAQKAEALRLMGINLTVAGECYIVGRSKANERDKWFVLSPSEIRRYGGGLRCNLGQGIYMDLDPTRDLAIRVWTPHPRMGWCSDSPTRSALLILREIEQLTRFTFSQIDSRLSGAGLLVIPSEMDFPDADVDENPVDTFVNMLGEAMSASMAQDGTAKSVVPVVVERPRSEVGGAENKFELIKFDSELSEKAKDLRDEAIRRLALSMDMAPEILLGSGEVSHWQAWHVEESTVKIHIEPMMNRICDALTQAYLKPALKVMGMNPDSYTFWFDTAPLTVRPNRLQDTLNLYERGITSKEEVLEAGNYNPNTAQPDEEEDTQRFMRELVLRDPSLFAVPEVRVALGVDIQIATPAIEGVPGETPPPPPPAPERSIEQDGPDAPPQPLPRQPASTTAAPTGTVVASIEWEALPAPSALLVAADASVRRALEVAGKRLHKSRDRDRWSQYPPHELHRYLKVKDHEHAQRLLLGAWGQLSCVVEGLEADPHDLQHLLHNYCTQLLILSMGHDRNLLAVALQRGGFSV